jgi:hypothetical protein
MDPDMHTRLRAIARGDFGRDHRVTQVTDLPSPSMQENGLTVPAIGADNGVTRVTRKHKMIWPSQNNDDYREVRVIEQAEAYGYEPGTLAELEERAAIAQSEAGFPADFAFAFAQLQMSLPDGVDHEHWQRAIDAMGQVLDQCRENAMEYMLP